MCDVTSVGVSVRSCEERDGTEEKEVSELRSELWEKERKLTDIRLEALSSAHQLEQLQEAMTHMQVCDVITPQSKQEVSYNYYYIHIFKY